MPRYRYGPHSGSSDSSDDDDDFVIYATFSTPVNSIGGSAVCAFRLRDITNVFNGHFKEQRDMSANWMPVPDHKVSFSRAFPAIFRTFSAGTVAQYLKGN
jgi:hypothetical protein